MSKITKDEVRRLGQLSRLSLTDEEVTKYQAEIEAILGFINTLTEADVSEYPATEQVTGLKNVMRSDDLQTDLPPPEELLKAAPQIDQDQFVVPRVIG